MAVNLSWSNGGPQALMAQIQDLPTRYRAAGEAVVTKVSADAAVYQKQLLDEATTGTGDARVASGAGEFAGRHISGKMIDDITNSVEATADTVTGTWGWPNPERYFLAQDFGYGHIPAADSLFNSFVKAEQELIAGIRDLTQNQGF